MTCVAAMEYRGRVYIASDSFAGTDSIRDVLARPKVFRKPKLGLVFAFASDIRGAQITEHYAEFRPISNETVESYLVTGVVAAIKQAYDTHGGNTSTTTYLVVCKGQLWTIQSDFSVIRSAHGYAAEGAGADVAVGALGALQGLVTNETMQPKAALDLALTMAVRHCPQVTPPFHHVRA